jgi:hypothetical protein
MDSIISKVVVQILKIFFDPLIFKFGVNPFLRKVGYVNHH